MLSETDIRAPRGAAYEPAARSRGDGQFLAVALIAVLGLVLSLAAAALTQDWSQAFALAGLD